MITGIETAGLVLAVFPLLISALEHYREGFEPLKDWWKFRTEFVGFAHIIGRQYLLFEENLEELLSPIVSSDAEMDMLLNNPQHPSWRNPRLEEMLRSRLPKSYERYRYTIDDMMTCMDVLQKKLHMQDGKVTWYSDESTAGNRIKCEYEFRRIQFVLSKKKRDKLARDLTANNEELQKILTSSERLATHRRRRKAPKGLKRIREQARELYHVLERGWNCRCLATKSSHHANLMLEKRMDVEKKSEKKKQKDGKDSSDGNFRVMFSLWPDMRSPAVSWQETTIRMITTDCQNVSLVVPSTSTLTVQGIPRRDHAKAKTNEPSNKSMKPPKKVAFTQNSSPQLEPLNEVTPILKEIADLCKAIHDAHNGKKQEPLGYLLDEQLRRHGIYPCLEPTCIATGAETVTLACLLSSPNDESTNSIGGFRLSRADRYSIAVILASSLLQLCNSPWIEETWSKYDIYFLKAAQGSPTPIIVEKPYITRRFRPYRSGSPENSTLCTDTGNKSQKSMQSLGIMLLELLFGRAIEDYPIRAKYLGPDGLPTDRTDFCTAEFWWQNEALGESGPEFYDAIRRCLFCAFGPNSTDLDNDDLRAAIYDQVVEPLESVAQHLV